MVAVRRLIRRFSLVPLAVALALMVSAHAQTVAQTISVAVSVPRSELAGRAHRELALVQVVLIHLVSYQDLDLATQAGERALRERIAATSRTVCEQLERLYPQYSESLARCTREAIADTTSQVEAAVDAAEHKAQSE